jgi:hypothetical protein
MRFPVIFNDSGVNVAVFIQIPFKGRGFRQIAVEVWSLVGNGEYNDLCDKYQSGWLMISMIEVKIPC